MLGCSSTKVETDGLLPAIHLYDGPTFRVLRSFLRENAWPPSLSLAVLSAKFGLIGGLAQIPYYNRRMTPLRAERLSPSVTALLQKLVLNHETVDLVMGKDYLDSIDLQAARAEGANFRFAEGGIGTKLNRLHDLLRRIPHQPRRIRKNAQPPNFRLEKSVSNLALQKAVKEFSSAGLKGVDVYAAGVDASGSNAGDWEALKWFWAGYFRRIGANLERYSVLRDAPRL